MCRGVDGFCRVGEGWMGVSGGGWVDGGVGGGWVGWVCRWMCPGGGWVCRGSVGWMGVSAGGWESGRCANFANFKCIFTHYIVIMHIHSKGFFVCLFVVVIRRH